MSSVIRFTGLHRGCLTGDSDSWPNGNIFNPASLDLLAIPALSSGLSLVSNYSLTPKIIITTTIAIAAPPSLPTYATTRRDTHICICPKTLALVGICLYMDMYM